MRIQRAASPPQSPGAGHLWGNMQLVSKPQLTCMDPLLHYAFFIYPYWAPCFPSVGTRLSCLKGLSS